MQGSRWLVAAAACAVVAAPIAAQAQTGSTGSTGTTGASGSTGTVGTVTAAFQPNKKGKGTKANVTVTSSNPNNAGSVPPPSSTTTVFLPKGSVIFTKGFKTCSMNTLNSSGPSGCPAGSQVGSGSSTIGAVIGGQGLTENAVVTAFNGPPVGGKPALELYASGTTPIPAQLTIQGVVSRTPAPYAYKIVFTVPPIATVPGGPNASIERFQAAVGGTAKFHGKKVNYITEPSVCKKSFPWKAIFNYTDGEVVTATTTSPC